MRFGFQKGRTCVLKQRRYKNRKCGAAIKWRRPTTDFSSLTSYLSLAWLKHVGLRYHLKSDTTASSEVLSGSQSAITKIRIRCPHDLQDTIRQHYGRYSKNESLCFRSGEIQVSIFLRCFAASLGAWWPTFRQIVVGSPSRFEMSSAEH